MSAAEIELARAGELLRAAVDIADGSADLAERRCALLECLAELTESDCGHWAWMRARPQSPEIMLVGVLHFGYSEEQMAAFSQFALDARAQDDLHARLKKQLREHPRPDNVWSVITSEVIPEIVADPDHWITQSMNRIGVCCYLQGGRFLPNDSESTLTLGRHLGKPQYGPADRVLMDLAFTNIPWLWASPDERVPQEHVEALTPRQRTVAFLLLDGLSRKRIASRLGISEETVNHHMKSVFRHFDVQSATELAALFLRSQ